NAAPEARPSAATSSAASMLTLAPGPMVCGQVMSRTRRETKTKDGQTRYNIALSLLSSQGIVVVERWSDEAMPKDLPVVGQQVELPVRVSAYLHGTVPQVRMVWGDDRAASAF